MLSIVWPKWRLFITLTNKAKKVTLYNISTFSDILVHVRLEALCVLHIYTCVYICTPMGRYTISWNRRDTGIIFGWRQKQRQNSFTLIAQLTSLAVHGGGLWTRNCRSHCHPHVSPDPKLEVEGSNQWGAPHPFAEGPPSRGEPARAQYPTHLPKDKITVHLSILQGNQAHQDSLKEHVTWCGCELDHLL